MCSRFAIQGPSRGPGPTVLCVLPSDETQGSNSPRYPCAIASEVWHPSVDHQDLAAFELAWNWTHEQLTQVGGQILVYTHWPAMLLPYPEVAHRRSTKSVRTAAHKRDRGLLGWDGGPVLALHLGEQALAAVASDPRTRALCVVFSDELSGRRSVHVWRTNTSPTPRSTTCRSFSPDGILRGARNCRDSRADPDERPLVAGGCHARLVCVGMEGVVLRVRLISGDSMDVTYEERDSGSEDEVIDQVLSTLADESGVLRCGHGDRLLVLYARGVAAVEVAPRGAVL
jgi:hypothetical protein